MLAFFIFLQVLLCLLILLLIKQNRDNYNQLKNYVEEHVNDYTSAHHFQNLPQYAPSYIKNVMKREKKVQIYNESKDIDAIMSGKRVEFFE